MRQRPRSQRLVTSALAICLSLAAAPTSAQTCPEAPEAAPDAAARREARALFRQGVACVRSDDFECAEEKFQAALALVPAATVRYNLASTLHEQGRNLEALEASRIVLECDEDVSASIRQHAEELVAEVRAATGQLTITVDAPEGAVVQVDGDEVDAARWAALPVEAGEHRVSLLVEGAAAMERTVAVEAGAEEEVALRYVLEPETVAEEGSTEMPLGPPSAPIYEEPAFWVGIGVAVAVVAMIVAASVVLGTEEP